MKEDSAFHFKKRDWKVVPRTEIYRENYDKIFRKIFCKICGLQCYDKHGTKDTGKEYICINCMDRYNKQIGEGKI